MEIRANRELERGDPTPDTNRNKWGDLGVRLRYADVLVSTFLNCCSHDPVCLLRLQWTGEVHLLTLFLELISFHR